MVRSYRLLPFDFHTYVHPDGSRHSRLICSLVCRKKKKTYCLVVWNVFLSRDKHFNNPFLFCYLCVTDGFSYPPLTLHRLFLLSCKTHPGCTRHPSPRSECGLQWWFDPGSHRSHVWTSVSHGTWCHRPRPTRGPWCGRTSYGTR